MDNHGIRVLCVGCRSRGNEATADWRAPLSERLVLRLGYHIVK